MALAAIMGFIASPTSFLSLYGHNDWQLIWDICRLTLVILGFYACHVLGFPVLIALLIYSIIRVLMNFILIMLNLKAITTLTHRTVSDY